MSVSTYFVNKYLVAVFVFVAPFDITYVKLSFAV